jgi:hypothetical protein
MNSSCTLTLALAVIGLLGSMCWSGSASAADMAMVTRAGTVVGAQAAATGFRTVVVFGEATSK